MNRYQDIIITKDSEGTRYYRNSKYPRVPLSINDVYVITTEGDRLDILAQQYYGDSSLWWIISIANETLKQDSLHITPGTQIRIPSNYSEILISYKTLNQQ
jgi:nucleoid-associated protein YgaU